MSGGMDWIIILAARMVTLADSPQNTIPATSNQKLSDKRLPMPLQMLSVR